MTTRLKVMVVDDSSLSHKKLDAMLAEMGHKVVGVARSGVDALTRYEQCWPDVVAMDITMPDMDGIEATRRLVAQFPEAQVIMVTSHAQKNMVMDALQAGAVGYIIKPVAADKLSQALSRITPLERAPAGSADSTAA